MDSTVKSFKNCKLPVLLLMVLFSCEYKRPTEGMITVKDDLGREVNIKKENNRVMALSSSLTEMLFVLCDEDQIIARTQNCDYPAEVLKKPIVNNYPIDFEKLLMLKPDIVFAKEGIVSLEEAAKIQDLGIPVYFQKYETTEDVFAGIQKLGKILKKELRAAKVVDSLKAELKSITDSARHLKKPSVLLIISKDKIFVYGKDTYASDMLEKAGGRNVMDSVFHNSFPAITTEYILHLNPEVMIGGRDVGLNGDFFQMYPELKKVDAYKNKRTYTLSESYISRPGPRVVEGIRFLKNVIHSNEE